MELQTKVRVTQREDQRGVEVTAPYAPGDQRAECLADRLRTAGGILTAYVSQTGTEQRVVPLDSVASVRPDTNHALVHMIDGSTLHSASRLFEHEAVVSRNYASRVKSRSASLGKRPTDERRRDEQSGQGPYVWRL